MEYGKGERTAALNSDHEVKIPKSLIHLEKAQLCYIHANNANNDTLTTKAKDLSEFRMSVYSEAQLAAVCHQVVGNGALMEETIKTIKVGVPQTRPVPFSLAQRSAPTKFELRRGEAMRCAKEEMRKAVQAMAEEEHGALERMKKMARRLGVEFNSKVGRA